MRLRGPCVAASLGCGLVLLTSGRGRAAAEEYWLPLPVEDIQTPEALDDPLGAAVGFLARATVRDGVVAIRRVTAARSGRSLVVGLSMLGEAPAARAGTISVRGIDSGLNVVAGRVVARGSGALFLESVGLSRRASRVARARPGPPSLEAPASAGSPSIEGIGLARSQRIGSRIPGVWCIAGRSVEDEARLGALGIGGVLASGTWGVAAGTLEGVPAGAIALEVQSRAAATVATELTVSDGRGIGALVSAESAPGPFRIRGRWRRRSEGVRRSACELGVDAGPRAARMKLLVSGGPSGAASEVGRAELECRLSFRGAGPVILRAGRSRTDGFSAASGVMVREERYAVLDATIARSAGRGLSILATRRERELAGGARVGSSVGGRIDMTWRGRGRLEVFVEAARADLAGGAAWGSGLFAGGSTALRTRTRPGVAASARGALRLGRWQVGGLVEGREDERGRRASAATIWLQRALPAVAHQGVTEAARSRQRG